MGGKLDRVLWLVVIGLRRVLGAILEAGVAMKSGKDDAWALEALALRLAQGEGR
jgi:hypothetical protein